MTHETTLRERARAAMLSGKIPACRPDGTLTGRGSGEICPICSAPVPETDMELEIEFARGGPCVDRYHVHPQCFAVWDAERPRP